MAMRSLMACSVASVNLRNRKANQPAGTTLPSPVRHARGREERGLAGAMVSVDAAAANAEAQWVGAALDASWGANFAAGGRRFARGLPGFLEGGATWRWVVRISLAHGPLGPWWLTIQMAFPGLRARDAVRAILGKTCQRSCPTVQSGCSDFTFSLG